MSQHTSEQALVALARAGDTAALERLLLLHHHKLRRHLSPAIPEDLRSVLEVDDVMQETFVAVFRDIGGFTQQPTASFISWLKRVAERRLSDMVKRLRRRKRGGGRRRVEVRARDGSGSLADLIELLSGREATPARPLKQAEAHRALDVAIAGLNEDYRRVLLLRYWEGKGLQQIADETGRTRDAIRGLLDRARQKLREAFERSSDYLSS